MKNINYPRKNLLSVLVQKIPHCLEVFNYLLTSSYRYNWTGRNSKYVFHDQDTSPLSSVTHHYSNCAMNYAIFS